MQRTDVACFVVFAGATTKLFVQYPRAGEARITCEVSPVRMAWNPAPIPKNASSERAHAGRLVTSAFKAIVRGSSTLSRSRPRRRFPQPQVQQRKQGPAHREFEPYRSVRRGEEALQAAGDHQQRNDSGDQASGFESALGDGVFPAQPAGEEHRVTETEACAAGDKNRGQLERAVGGDETPKQDRHSVLVAGGAHDAEHHAVKEQGVEGGQTRGDSAGKGG